MNLHTIASIGQWTTSVLFVAGLVVVLLGATWWSIALGIWFAFFLVLGMGLAIRRGGWPLVAGLLVETFVIFAGVGLVHFLIEKDRAEGADAILARIHGSADWQATEAQVKQAQVTEAVLTAKLSTTPAWALADLTNAIKAQTATATAGIQHLGELEASAKTAKIVTGATAFDAFGPDSVVIVLLILGVGNEALAVINTIAGRTARGLRGPAQKLRVEVAQSEQEYLRARETLRSTGRPSGYREVGAFLGIGESKARKIMETIGAKVREAKS